MPDFIQTAVKDIDDQLRALKDEASRLEAARAALAGPTGRRGRPSSNGTARTRARSASRRNGRPATPRSRGGHTRANQTLELVRDKPGITIPEIAKAMKIEPNYLYRLLPRLESTARSSATARAGTRRRPRHPRVPRPCASRHAPPSPSRRRRRLGPRGLGAPRRRRRRPTAARLTAPPSRRCSQRSPAVKR